METVDNRTQANRDFVNNIVEASLRIGLISVVLIACFGIVRPFVMPIVWGGIIAVTLMPVTLLLKNLLGGRQSAAAGLITLLAIALLVTPMVFISDSLIDSGQKLAAIFKEGGVRVPDPPAEVADWPLVGGPVHAFWNLASSNLEAALRQVEPQLETVGVWLLESAAGGVVSVLLFFVSLVIAGLLMAKSDAVEASIKGLMARVAGEHGVAWTDLSAATVRSVVQGVLGVAVIQAALAAIGLVVMDISAWGIWVVGVLLLAIVQLPPILILGPIVAYVWSYADTTPALIFTVYNLIVSSSDTFLKPMLLGRGLDVPMPVILIGAIGGMMASGIIGLFAGAVVLAIGHKLFTLWIESAPA